MRVSRLLPEVLLLGATVAWGTTFVVVHDLLPHVSVHLLLALRFTLAAAVLAPLVLLRRGRPDRRAWKAGAVVGTWLYLGFALQTWGLRGTPPARAAFLTAMYVVAVPVLLVLVWRRTPRPTSVAGVLLASAGLALLTGVGRTGGGLTSSDVAVLAGAVAFALQILAVDGWAQRIDPLTLLLVEIAVVAALAWPGTLLLETPRLAPMAAVWGGIAGLALVATLGALAAQNYAQPRTTPTRTAVIFSMEPIFAALTSVALGRERLGAVAVAGCVLIVAGVLVAEVPALRRDARVPGPSGV